VNWRKDKMGINYEWGERSAKDLGKWMKIKENFKMIRCCTIYVLNAHEDINGWL